MMKICQTVYAESEATFKELKINESIYVNNEPKRTRTNSNFMSSFQFVLIRCLNYLRNRTRMTRIYTDIFNPRASVSSAQSAAFYLKSHNNNVSVFICVHMWLNRMALPDEKMLAAELERTHRMLEGRRLGGYEKSQ